MEDGVRKLLSIVIVLSLCAIPGFALTDAPADTHVQALSGVNFEDMALADALTKAGKESKLVLIDVFSPT